MGSYDRLRELLPRPFVLTIRMLDYVNEIYLIIITGHPDTAILAAIGAAVFSGFAAGSELWVGFNTYLPF